MPETLDLLIAAKRVHTAAGTPANALLLRNGRIAAVGDSTALRAYAPHARRLDLPDATVTAGLIDAHVHVTEWAFSRTLPDLTAAGSPEAAAAMIHPAAGTGWIRGRGWNSHSWNGRSAHRAVLDAVSPDRPVALQSHDMHSVWLNSAALRHAGITAETPDPAGGEIVHDDNGEPTGLLLENAGQLVTACMPAPTRSEMKSAVVAAQQELHRLGFTGVHSFPGLHIPEPDPFTILQDMLACDELRLRVLQHIPAHDLDAAIQLGVRSGFGNEWLRIGAVKFFLDGALGSRTAWMRAPYAGSDSTGVNVLDRATFAEAVTRAAAAGIAATVHAIGDAAVTLAYEVLSDPALRVRGMKHRIEHVQCCPPELLDRFGPADIVCSVQPCHLMSDWRAADCSWGERGRSTYAFASLLRGGATLAFGSDAPVEPIDPRRGLFAAVMRQDDAREPAAGWYATERLDLRAAFDAFTTGPALAAGTEAVQGRIAEGAWGDVVAWDMDPFEIEADHLTRMRCVATVVGGNIVYS